MAVSFPSDTRDAEVAQARAEEQAAVAEGVYLTPKEDGGSGVPVGQSPDDLRGLRVIVDPYHTDQGFDSFSFELDGVRDPDLAAAAKDTAEMRGRTTTDFMAAQLQTLRAVATAKAARSHQVDAARRPDPPQAGHAVGANPAGRIGPIVWNMGARGTNYAYYDEAYIHEHSLVLAADMSAGRDVFVPPVSDETFEVRLPDRGVPPVRVYSAGVTFPFKNYLICVFPIERG